MTVQSGLQAMKLQELKSKTPTDLLSFAEELEIENARLKKLLAESLLENEVTREVLRKKW